MAVEVKYVFDYGVIPVMPEKDDPDPILPVRNCFGEKRNGIVKSQHVDKEKRDYWAVEMGGENYHVYLSHVVWEPNG